MAKKATSKSSGGSKAGPKTRAVTTRKTGSGSKESMGDALIKLMQSPLVAELVTVAATAALASLAEHGFSSGGGGSRGKRAGKAVKEAGKAAASAIGRRLGNEFVEIRKASKVGAKAKA
jgi:hypothetical protein